MYLKSIGKTFIAEFSMKQLLEIIENDLFETQAFIDDLPAHDGWEFKAIMKLTCHAERVRSFLHFIPSNSSFYDFLDTYCNRYLLNPTTDYTLLRSYLFVFKNKELSSSVSDLKIVSSYA